MASRSAVSNILKTSDNASYPCDYLCPSSDKRVDAVTFCRNCRQHLCQECLRVHDTINRGKDHTLVDSDHVEETLNDVSIETCDVHKDVIDLFCVRHNVVCCRACVEKEHRSCDICHLPTYAKGVSSTDEFNDVISTLQAARSRLDALQESREDSKLNLTKQKEDIEKSFKDFRLELNKLLDKLKKDALEALKQKYTALTDAINQDIDQLQSTIESLESTLNQLAVETHSRDTSLFIIMKEAKPIATSGTQFLNEMEQKVIKDEIYFATNPILTTALQECKSLGAITEHPCEDLYLKMAEDDVACRISSMCSLPDGSAILADHNNCSLKRLDRNNKLVDCLKLPYRPWGVCTAYERLVAVTLPLMNKIQLVTINGGMELTSTFPVKGLCYELAFKSGELFVSCFEQGKGRVEVYTTSGTWLRTIDQRASSGDMNDTGETLFASPRQIAVSSDGRRIFIAEDSKRVVILDTDGVLITSVTHPDLRGAISVCVGKDDQVFVTGYHSHNVFRLVNDGQLEEILSKDDGVKLPRFLHAVTGSNQLMIGMEERGVVRVYDL